MPKEAKFSPLPPQPLPLQAKGILWILAGAVCLTVAYRHKGFEVMPDALGYILMAIGLKQLEAHAPVLRRARILAIAGAVISLPSIYASGLMNLMTQGLWNYFDTLVLMPLLIAFGLVLARCIIRGITGLAQRTGGHETLVAQGRKLFVLLLSVRIVAGLSLWIGVPPLPRFAASGIWMIGIAGEIIYMLYLWRAYQSLAGETIKPAP